MAKAPPSSNQTLAQDGLTVPQIEKGLTVDHLQRGLTTAHLGQGLAAASPANQQGTGSQPAATPAAPAAPAAQKK